MVPRSLTVWLQRAGRAGRREGVVARAILLVQPSVFQAVAAAGGSVDDAVVYKKQIEEGLRCWIETAGCRRDTADRYFNNPPRTQRT